MKIIKTQKRKIGLWKKEKEIFSKYAVFGSYKNTSGVRIAGGLIEASCCCSSN